MSLYNLQEEKKGRYVILGRVVGNHGRPISDAQVFLRPKTDTRRDDDLILIEKTDPQGRFRIEGTMLQDNAEWKLFATSPPPLGAFQQISPPFDDLDVRDNAYNGTTVIIKKDQEVNIGDVIEHVRYALVKLQIQANNGSPLLTRPDQWQEVILRVRDRKGDIIRGEKQVYYPINGQHINLKESVINLALPEGIWGIEVSLTRMRDKWAALDKLVTVTASEQPALVGLRIASSQRWQEAKYITEIISKASTPMSAKRELEYMGIQYSEDSFVQRALRGNNLAVKLFLLSGMSPDTKNKSGALALVAAGNHTEILEILLNGGANVNERNSEGITALMAASASGNIASINLLYSRHASVNEKANNGVTALILAVGGNKYNAVKQLLLLGANPNVEDENGRTPLKLAELTGNKDIVSLLKGVGSKK